MLSNLRRGMSLVDVLVGTAIMLIIFLAIFGAFKLSIDLVYSTKAKAGGLALVTERMEYIRGLPYSSLGTVGGIPAGTIPQLEQKTLNNIPYTLRTFIEYADAPEDGLGSADQNSITADYKVVKVEADWSLRGLPRSTFTVTSVAPVGLETLASGGTLRVNVIDAAAATVSGASVRVVNPSTTPAIDVTAASNSAGTVSFPGAPTAAGYQITVTKSGYSSAQTYSVSGANPNPSPGHVAVVNAQTSTVSLAIDLLAKLRMKTYAPIGAGAFTDTFTNSSKLAATTSATVAGGALVLQSTAGAYAPAGGAQSISVAPAYLAAWSNLVIAASVPAETNLKVSLYYPDGDGYVLVPDTDLPGNSVGFGAGTTSIASLATGTYNTLRLSAVLTTASSTLTPSILDWSLSYTAGPTPLPGVGLAIHGTKKIGTTSGGTPIYKLSSTGSTDASGEWLIDPIEWDAYTVTLNGATYDIVERCPNAISVAPASDTSVAITVLAHTAQSLRVAVDAGGAVVSGATVTITGPTNTSQSTSACGQAFFSGIPAGTYTVSVQKAGYQTNTQSFTVSGTAELSVTLSP